jgi:hypothetical protein
MWDPKLRLYAGDASEKLAMPSFFDQREDARGADIRLPMFISKICGFPSSIPRQFSNLFPLARLLNFPSLRFPDGVRSRL